MRGKAPYAKRYSRGMLLWAAGLMLLALNACQPAPTAEPMPTASTLVVNVSPELRALTEQFQTCAKGLPNTGLALVDSAEPAAAAAITLRWGADPAPQGYAAVIGEEDLAVVVNPENALERISLEDLRSIYQGALFEWENGAGEIEAWSYPPGADSLRQFEAAVMQNTPVNRRAAGIVPDPSAMVETVASSPAAIGFLPKRWLSDEVKTLTVEGLPPESLRAPILAISSSEPRGTPRAWLICLQEALQ